MGLRLLALDTSTHRTSVAVGDGVSVFGSHSGEGGAQASAGLLPAIQALLTDAGWTLSDLDAIVMGRGPGAFTGLRTAVAVTQGLAYGTRSERHPHGLPVLPVDTLHAVAEDARQQWVAQAQAATRPLWVLSALDARMGELYSALYQLKPAGPSQTTRPDGPSQPLVDGPWLCTPAQLVQRVRGEARLDPAEPATCLCAGNAGNMLDGVLGPAWTHIDAWPTAEALLRLAPRLLQQGLAVEAPQAQPLYVRDKVALTTAERSQTLQP